MVISSLDLAAKNDLTFLAELVRDLREAAPAWEPLLTGALARDILLYHAYGIPVLLPKTLTLDLQSPIGTSSKLFGLR
jgi:hypothetical protein